MKRFLAITLVIAFLIGCKPKVLSGEDLKKKLIETMQTFLNTDPKPGTSFTVNDVNYYTEVTKKSYDCEFHVTMHLNNRDTTGLMMAVISNDFKSVDRKPW